MKCKHCENSIDIQAALDSAECSWPLLQTIWHVCANCNNGNHIRFDNGLAQVINLLGSPGNEYDIVSSVNEPTIEVRVDPQYLHVWFNGKHHEVKERA